MTHHRLAMPLRASALGAACCLLCTWAHADVPAGFASSPIDLLASVQDVHNPGGTVFSDQHEVLGSTPIPKQSAEYLYLAPIGSNFSGHSTQITRAFASSLAESDGNGGVGVSSWIAGSAVPGTPATDSLVAQTTWRQSFTYLGTDTISVEFHYVLPAITVGLIGVAPNRDSISATEHALAQASLSSFVTHGDGSISPTGSFELGLQVDEYQVPLGPGVYANFGDLRVIERGATVPLDTPLHFNDDDYNPEWTLGEVAGVHPLATLSYGDALVYQYTLTATGHTLGGEHGYYAFVGDPFGVDVVSGNLGITATLLPVPELPQPLLLAAGLAWLGARRLKAGRLNAGSVRAGRVSARRPNA